MNEIVETVVKVLPTAIATAKWVMELIEKRKEIIEVSQPMQDFYEENKDKADEELKNMKIPAELQEEIIRQLNKQSNESNQLRYMNGVIFVMEKEFGDDIEEVKDALKSIMEYRDIDGEWDESLLPYQEVVDDIIDTYMESYASEAEGDYGVENDSFYINFEIPDVGWHLYKPEEIQKLANAFNTLLEETTDINNKIKSYMIF